jgi:acyl-CoA synthetase (AMP-forming)/AMP-acid ligase II
VVDIDESADRVYFEPLPKTSTGKIQKNVLRDRARERAGRAQYAAGDPHAQAGWLAGEREGRPL